MCKERWNTRDLLLDAENPSNPSSYVCKIKAVYPWENTQLSFFAGQLYILAKEGGYKGSVEDFNRTFGTLLEEKTITYLPLEDFPSEGATDHLYFDTNEKILYYWDNGYYPIQSTLITDTIINGGEI